MAQLRADIYSGQRFTEAGVVASGLAHSQPQLEKRSWRGVLGEECGWTRELLIGELAASGCHYGVSSVSGEECVAPVTGVGSC